VFGGIIPTIAGDLIFDVTLIDVKCGSNIKIDRFFLNQLLSYYFLNLLDTSKDKKEINKIGIYFARVDILWVHNLNDFNTIDELHQFSQNLLNL